MFVSDKPYSARILARYTEHWDRRDDKRGMVHPLHLAAKYCSSVIIRFIGDWVGGWEYRDDSGRTPMHWAALYGNVPAMRGLLKLGADIDAVDNEGNTPLHLAATKNDADVVDFFEMNDSQAFTMQDHEGHTPLMRLVSSRTKWSEEMFSTMVNCCPEAIDMVDSQGWTALHHAISHGFADAPYDFRAAGSKAHNMKCHAGDTPMHLAVLYNSVDCIRELWDNGSELDVQSNDGSTPMHIAACFSELGVDLIGYLLLLCSRAYWIPDDLDRYPRDFMTAEQAAKADALVPRMTMLEMVRLAANVHSRVVARRHLE